MNIQASKVATVYGAIISNPGITSREINKQYGTSEIGSTLKALEKRGAIIAAPGASERNTKFYKGRAPVKLNQPRGTTQKKLEESFDVAAVRLEVTNGIKMLENILKTLEKAHA